MSIKIITNYKSCPYCNQFVKSFSSLDSLKYGYVFSKCKKCKREFINNNKEYYMIPPSELIFDFLKLFFLYTITVTLFVCSLFILVDEIYTFYSFIISSFLFIIYYIVKRKIDINNSKKRLASEEYCNKLISCNLLTRNQLDKIPNSRC